MDLGSALDARQKYENISDFVLSSCPVGLTHILEAASFFFSETHKTLKKISINLIKIANDSFGLNAG